MDALRFRLRIYIAVFLVVMLTGTIGFTLIEDFNLADAFYFSIVTIATVGYGDIHPLTTAGKFLSVFLIVFGVGTFMAAIASATEIMLSRRERDTRLEQLDRVIGVFFGQIGTRLLALSCSCDPDIKKLGNLLKVKANWTDADFQKGNEYLSSHPYQVKVTNRDLTELKELLNAGTPLILQLFENPNLSENENFSELLRTTLHLTEELAARDDLSKTPGKDRAHLEGDIRRVYILLVREWLNHMAHLQKNYPYLFSLALRTNPFDKSASPMVT